MRTLLLILLTTIVSLGQETKTQQFEILGISKIQARADHTVLKVTLGGEGNDYNKLVKETNDKTETIRKVLIKIGLKDDQIVISDFMTKDNSVYRDFDSESTSKFEVYRVINAKYTFDKDLNSKIINTLATHEIQPNFRFQFGLSDEKKNSLRNELIKKALSDARSKADIIASTYNVKIKRILKVKYGNTTIDPELRGNSVDLVGDSIQPYYTEYKEDSPEFDYMETVLVIWEFEE
jgi:uncharacterized protein YggE